jgi:alanine dehydrogenase
MGMQKANMTLLLRSHEVEGLLDLKGAMQVLEQVYREQAAGEVKAIAPLRLMDRGIRLVAGGLAASDRVGLRLSPTGGIALALVYEMSSGNLLSIMGYPFSSLRISATVGLALDRMAPADVKTAALIGSGRLAPALLDAVVGLRPIERVVVYSRSAERRRSFAERSGRQYGIEFRAASSPQGALAEADLVLVSTNAPEPALCGQWLRPGLSVFGCGRPNEFDDEVYLRADLIVVSSKTHELGYYDTKLDRPLIRLSQAGQVSWHAVAELGEIVAGRVLLPEAQKSLTIFRESQGGYSDLALAAAAYHQAVERGLGQTITVD